MRMDEPTRADASAPGARVRLEGGEREVAGLQAEGRRLYDEEQRLRAERAAGRLDWAAHLRFAADLRAHREQLGRFRAGR
jgi:hypothetical protein